MKGSPLRNAIEDSVSARQCSFSERLEWTRGLLAAGTALVSDKDPVSTACPLLEPRTVPMFITVPRLLRPRAKKAGLRTNPVSFSNKAEGQIWF